MLLSWFSSFSVDMVLRGMRGGDEWQEYVKVQGDLSFPRLPLIDGLRGAVHEPSESGLREFHLRPPRFQVFFGHDRNPFTVHRTLCRIAE